MNEPIDASSVALTFDKEAYTGVAGRLCRYAGNAERGLHIELAPGDVLNVTAAQIKQIFADLSAFNLLLQDPLGMRGSPNIVESIAYFAQGRPAIHGMPVHGFTPCRSSAHEAGRAELSIRDEHSSIV